MSFSPDETESFSYAQDPWIPASEHDEARIRLVEIEFIEADPGHRYSEAGEQAHHKVDAKVGVLSCRLFWTPLKDPKPFKALSYVWGNGPLSQPIQGNGKRFLITESFLAFVSSLP